MEPRILIADDQEIVRQGVSTLIVRSRPGWRICGEARNGNEAIDTAAALNPDVIVLDITMPELSGLEAARRIMRLNTGCRIIMFTMHESESLDGEVRSAGAHGYVLKSQATRNLIIAIEALLSGGTFYGVPALPEGESDVKPDSGSTFWGTLPLGCF